LHGIGQCPRKRAGFGRDERGIMRDNGSTFAWFTDPAGNILSVIEETSQAAVTGTPAADP
jgi:hypothetical protein